jgi:radical SAM protein with 4Fe4S-binding SPASM domain
VNVKRLFVDGRTLASILTWRRFLNGFLILLSYQFSRVLKQPVHYGSPLAISVEPTTSCNLRCPECPSGLRSFSRPTGMLEPVFFKRLLDQLAPRLWSINFYFQGEPFLNRNLTEMISEAVSRNVFTSTSTNAHFLDDETARKTVESGLHRLIVSIDGTTQETYEQYRIGGSLHKVIEGTKRVLFWKEKLKRNYPQVIFQFLVVKPNEHQINDVLGLAKDLGVDEVRFKTAQVYDFENGNPLIPENDDYSRYRKGNDGKWKLKNKLFNRCWRMWQGCVITWDGAVVPCCFDKDARHQLGQLNEQSFAEIWNSSEYKQFRSSVFSNRQGIDICTNCTEGTKVWG